MLYIEYEPSMGFALRDGDLEAEIVLLKTRIKGMTKKDDYTRMYATENIFRRVRLEVARGLIDFKMIVFLWKGCIVRIDKNGDYLEPPKDFLRISYEVSKQLLEQQHKNFEEKETTR